MVLADRAARLALSCVVDGGDLSVTDAVDRRGAPATWADLMEGGFGAPLAQRGAAFDGDLAERRATAAAARFVVPDDDEWPEALGDLRHCGAVQRRGGVPFGLWLRGPGLLLDVVDRSVAIVGSRAATSYGTGVATDLAAELAERGVTVVSWRRLRNRCCCPPRRARGGRPHAVCGGQWGGHGLSTRKRQVVQRTRGRSSAGLRTSTGCTPDEDAIPRPEPVDRRPLERNGDR